MRVSNRIRGSLILTSLLFMGACSGDAGNVTAPIEPTLNTVPTGSLKLAKVGPLGTTATFSISATGGTLPLGSTVTLDACVDNQPCNTTVVWQATDASIVEITITEVSFTGNVELDRITVNSGLDGDFNYFRPATPTVTTRLDNTHDALVRFKNVPVDNPPPPPPPPGDGTAGCTPGFWKQTQHFQFWTAPYTPGTLFDDVFANAFPGKTLLDVLRQGGGEFNALGRHTVAALLNGASEDVDYGMTAQHVIDAFNAAWTSGDPTPLHDELEDRNERDCTAKD